MIRDILFNIIYWPIFAICLIVLYPFVYFFNQEQTYKIAFKAVCNWTLFCLKIFNKIDYKVENIENLKKELEKSPVIIGCNHQSAWETFIFAKLFTKLSIVVKKELLNVPIAGLYFKRLKCIPVNRSSPVSSIKDLLKYGKESVEKGISVLIFPNGTRADFNEEVEYKSGLYALYKSLKVPVIPAYVNSGKFWPRRSFKKHKGTIILSFKTPIQTELSKEEFMQAFSLSMNNIH